ncbi:hypothetical protein JX266_004304 [Neoarthrinium moseri]|nr:hypothetical protein JX266_004304 [Neoarthrinium moseri]
MAGLWIPVPVVVAGMAPYTVVPPSPPVPLPANFARWDAPWPFTGNGNWMNGWTPQLTIDQIQAFLRVIRAIRNGESMGWDNPAWRQTASERQLTVALNAMNYLTAGRTSGGRWAYVYGVTTVLDSGPHSRPRDIVLPPRVRQDLAAPWNTTSLAYNANHQNMSRYRAVIFIHRHKSSMEPGGVSSYNTPVYSVTIWCRQRARLDWFDTGVGSATERVKRTVDINNFWLRVATNFPAGATPRPSLPMLTRHTTSRLTEAVFNRAWQSPVKGQTLWTVLGWTLQTLASSEHPGPVLGPDSPWDRIETMGGLRAQQIPRWYVCLVFLLWNNRNRPVMPVAIRNSMHTVNSFRAAYGNLANKLLKDGVRVAKLDFTGANRIPVARSNALVA